MSGKIAVFLAFVCVILISVVLLQQKDINALETHKNTLKNEIERYANGKLEAANTIQKIQEKIKYVKEPCDCFNTPLPDSVLAIVRGN